MSSLIKRLVELIKSKKGDVSIFIFLMIILILVVCSFTALEYGRVVRTEPFTIKNEPLEKKIQSRRMLADRTISLFTAGGINSVKTTGLITVYDQNGYKIDSTEISSLYPIYNYSKMQLIAGPQLSVQVNEVGTLTSFVATAGGVKRTTNTFTIGDTTSWKTYSSSNPYQVVSAGIVTPAGFIDPAQLSNSDTFYWVDIDDLKSKSILSVDSYALVTFRSNHDGSYNVTFDKTKLSSLEFESLGGDVDIVISGQSYTGSKLGITEPATVVFSGTTTNVKLISN